MLISPDDALSMMLADGHNVKAALDPRGNPNQTSVAKYQPHPAHNTANQPQ
jgi:hypothetical protein